MMSAMCRHCGTRFMLEVKPTGEIGRVEGVRYVRWSARPVSRWRRIRWFFAAYLYDAAARLSR